MTDEEKKTIIELDHFINMTAYWKQEEYTNSEIDNYIKLVLNLIEKQSKEIEELKEKEKNLLIQLKDSEKELLEVCEKLRNSISKDKIKAKNEEVKDVTKRYENMIEAFECDFNLPFDYNDFTMFDDLKRLIQNKNKRLVKDIELLQELSFGIRYGNLKIIDKRNKLEGIIWN